MNIQTKKFKINDLTLWDENARFPDKYYNSDEKELIKFFVSKPEYKIKQLLEAIVKDIDLPQLEKLVVWNEEGANIVLEGNRRLTVYKLLLRPELTDNKSLVKKLAELKEKIAIDNNFELECLVVNKEQGFRYIDRKHANNNNEVNWQDVERANYNIRRGSSNHNELLKIGISNIVQSLDLPEEMKEQVLGRNYVTTFFRTIATAPAKKKYAYKILEDGKLEVGYKNFHEELKVIIYSILNKQNFDGQKIDSRTLNKTENIEEFIQSINHLDSKKVEKEIEKRTSEDLFGDKSISIGKNTAPSNPNNNSGRSKPMPTGLFLASDIPFKINSSSLRILYNELKDINVKSFPNATHDLLRSFLECSLIFYLKEINEFKDIKKSNHHNPKLGEMLAHIISGKCKTITDRNLIETLKAIKTDYSEAYSIERMNMINHNENCASTEKDVRKAWAQLESLFKIILNPSL